MTDIRARAIQIYDDFTHEHRDRRRMLRAMAALAGSMAAAETLVAAIAASPAAAQQVPADDPRLTVDTRALALPQGELRCYQARRADAAGPAPAVMVIHENRGLNAHIEDVCRRVALEGFFAIAPDFLSFDGGTPADEDVARERIGALDLGATVAAGTAALAAFRADPLANGHLGAVGFCWGGGMVNRLAVAAGRGLDAAVAYYGPAPDPVEARRVEAAMLLHYAGNDARVNATGAPWTDALQAAGKDATAYIYPGVDHAFNNDTSAARYDAAAAALAWRRTIDFLHAHLDGHA